MDGIIIINKPKGKTSHDMVYFTRRLFGIKKVGHTGTLDPDATGVLPVCIGKATKVCDMLTESDKAYRARLVLGKTTDTLDASGKVLTETKVSLEKSEIENAIMSFIGETEQVPPMFSAIKKDGKKLYELARKGISVEREARKITIFDIAIEEIDIENYTATFTVHCSKGTYIRTLCDDIGRKLGCGAYMDSLERIKSAGFTIDNSYTQEELLKMKEDGTLFGAVIPIDTLFSAYGEVRLSEFLANKVKNGIRIRKEGIKEEVAEGELYRVYSNSGEFLCISRYENGELIMQKSFWN